MSTRKNKKIKILVNSVILILVGGLIVSGIFLYKYTAESAGRNKYSLVDSDSLLHTFPPALQALFYNNDTIKLCDSKLYFTTLTKDIEILKDGTDNIDTIYSYLWVKSIKDWSLSKCKVYKGSVDEGFKTMRNMFFSDSKLWVLKNWDSTYFDKQGREIKSINSEGYKKIIDYQDKNKLILTYYYPDKQDEKYEVVRNPETGKDLNERKFINIKIDGTPDWTLEHELRYKYTENSDERWTFNTNNSNQKLECVFYEKSEHFPDSSTIYKKYSVDLSGNKILRDSIYELSKNYMYVKSAYSYSEFDKNDINKSIDSVIIDKNTSRHYQFNTNINNEGKTVGYKWIEKTDSLNRKYYIYQEMWSNDYNNFVPSLEIKNYFSDSIEISAKKSFIPGKNYPDVPAKKANIYNSITYKFKTDSSSWYNVYLQGVSGQECYYTEGIEEVTNITEKNKIEIISYE